MPLSYEINEQVEMSEIKQAIKDLIHSQRETDVRFKEPDRRFKESREDLDKQFAELGKYIRQIQGHFDTQWGKLVESLVEGDVVRLLQDRGIYIASLSTRVKGRYNKEHYEFDIIAHNGDEIVIIEVKTTLRVKDVDKHIDRLKKAKIWMTEYRNHNIYGGVAFLKAEEESDTYADHQKLFVIKATGDSSAIINDPDFVPRAY